MDMVPIVNYNFFCRNTYATYVLDTYILDMVAIVNYNFVLQKDLCVLHIGHGSDRLNLPCLPTYCVCQLAVSVNLLCI